MHQQVWRSVQAFKKRIKSCAFSPYSNSWPVWKASATQNAINFCGVVVCAKSLWPEKQQVSSSSACLTVCKWKFWPAYTQLTHTNNGRITQVTLSSPTCTLWLVQARFALSTLIDLFICISIQSLMDLLWAEMSDSHQKSCTVCSLTSTFLISKGAMKTKKGKLKVVIHHKPNLQMQILASLYTTHAHKSWPSAMVQRPYRHGPLYAEMVVRSSRSKRFFFQFCWPKVMLPFHRTIGSFTVWCDASGSS